MLNSIFENYIQSISTKFSYEETSEMGYRTDFEVLLKGIFESINVTRFDHDAKATKGNKPDFVVRKNSIPILYIEAKIIGESLDKVEKSEQMSRYFGYANLVLTDYVEFRFYRNGIRYGEPIKIAIYDKKTKVISPQPLNYEYLAKTLLDFATSHKEPIKSGKHLAKIMGGKAQRIRDNIRHFFESEKGKINDLTRLFETLKQLLVTDLDGDAFADMYAQTLVYGLFVARYYDKSPDSFSRQEARELIPNSNPLLRHFFDHIVGADFDTRLKYIVDELCEVFSHANVEELMKEYFNKGKDNQNQDSPDPVIHFYEDFLEEYDPELRKKMGAYYTPQPVVKFIVRAVDQILKKDFGLIAGIADTSKTADNVHKVQILDPAVGTGTFISAVVGLIYEGFLKSGQKGRWPSYVHNDLLPRLHGFELMMAPYTIAHLKLGIAFRQTGFWDFHRRLGIYLTNSLEKGPIQQNLLSFGLAQSIAEESKVASDIKDKTPIMVVVGNPPYSVSSSNKGEWIMNLIKDYKKDLNEKKINLDDDYIKFIRFSESFIEKNKSGIVAMITNNSFIDGITHRQMRKHLLETFDEIYILDLHGNSKKKEKAEDGGPDENVFNIMQGVSINFFIRKNEEKKTLGKVQHYEIFGKREDKFIFLNENNLQDVKWENIKYTEPYYFYVPRNNEALAEYEQGFRIDELMPHYNSGIQTKNDGLSIKFNQEDLDLVIQDFIENPVEELTQKYHLKDTSGWNVKKAKKSLEKKYNKIKILYRPFDLRNTLIQEESGGFIGRSRYKTSKHFLNKNLGLITVRQQSTFNFQHILVTDSMIESGAISLQTKEWGYIFPLYLYDDSGSKTLNLNQEILVRIKNNIGDFTPEQLLDYVYAILYSPIYRDKYKELLKIDFPRIKYPDNRETFIRFAKYGCELRLLHLMESPNLNKLITTYPEGGLNNVDVPTYKDGNLYINEKQYFGNVPETAWNFYIGGYQPAQKWLKDRKGRVLSNEDLEHYQKLIVVLEETNKLMKEIDKNWQQT